LSVGFGLYRVLSWVLSYVLVESFSSKLLNKSELEKVNYQQLTGKEHVLSLNEFYCLKGGEARSFSGPAVGEKA
jgi:hypothetical protein